MTTTKKSFFHIDGTVNLAFIGMSLGVICSVALWGVKMDSRLSSLEQDRAELRADLREIKSGLRDVSIDLATVRGRMAENTLGKK
jgi:hypothetical protein